MENESMERFDADGVVVDESMAIEDEFLSQVTAIEIGRIDEEMARLPAELARWNMRLTEAYKALLIAEADLKREQSKAYLLHSQVVGPNGKSPSVDLIKARVSADDGVDAMNAAWIAAKVDYERLRSISHTMSKKADMLQGINNRVNAELRSNPALAAAVT